jgi:hypothetical protein
MFGLTSTACVQSWIALLFIYILYLCLGAIVFSVLECPEELDGRKNDLDRMVRRYGTKCRGQLLSNEQRWARATFF